MGYGPISQNCKLQRKAEICDSGPGAIRHITAWSRNSSDQWRDTCDFSEARKTDWNKWHIHCGHSTPLWIQTGDKKQRALRQNSRSQDCWLLKPQLNHSLSTIAIVILLAITAFSKALIIPSMKWQTDHSYPKHCNCIRRSLLSQQ